MSELFKTLVDQEHVRRLLGSIQQATGIPVSLLGSDGELLADAGWNDLCKCFHSQTTLGQKQCRATRKHFTEVLPDAGTSAPLEHYCQNGLIEIGLPVIVEKRHYATLVFGQFLPENVDREKFRQQAVLMGVDQPAYMNAVSSAPVIDRAVVDNLLTVYSGVIDVLVRIGLQHLEQRQIADEVRASEQKFRALFDGSNDSIYILDLNGMILETNQRTCDRLGFSHAELCAMHVTGLGDASHMMEVDGRLRRFKKKGRLFFETNHRCKDGTLIPVEVNGRVIDYGNDEAILCTARDLRRRYTAQQALKQSERQFRSIIDSSPMGVLLYRCDSGGQLLLIGSNPSADEILGINTADLHGMPMEEAFPILAETDLPQIYRRICCNGERYFVNNFGYEDGRINGVFEVHAFQTAPNMMAAFFLDVTEKIRADQILRESEEKYRLLFSAEKDAILICDKDSLKLTDANDAAVTLYGHSYEQLLRLKVDDLLSAPLLFKEDLNKLLCGDCDVLSLFHKKQDGSLFPVEITAGTFDWSGLQLLVLIVRDASEREKINRVKDEMLSSVSHEMRTPLTAMLGYTELLIADDVGAQQRQNFLKTIYREGERLRDLIDDLLDLQRLRAGFLSKQMEGIDLSLLLYEVSSLFNETAKDHSIKVDCAADVGLIVCDSNKILRALKNLVTNAIKFSPNGGEVRISADLFAEGNMVRISVQDFGLGVPDEIREKLFDRFFRVCQPEVKNLSGAGIGLSLVREIAKMHGGTIWFDSLHGQGSTFNLDLPVAGTP
jgi:PAS domain S-box-containing protein